ncbi:hypothetical protein [Priestia aryabhattai]|uniref:hypothetical protein n=1 Tax=Priestia aryabhattai TaxID=412384 RepID=UPI002E1F4343|nr:hypothetical protein [Priestia aryabhattai]
MIIGLKIIAGLLAYFTVPVAFAIFFAYLNDGFDTFWDEFIDVMPFWFLLTAVTGVLVGLGCILSM